MQLEQSFEVARPIDVVWRGFGDLAATASCIPGAEISNVKDNTRATGVFKVQLGPIKAAFGGDAEVSRDDATHSGVITGAGKDGKNATRVKATVKYRLSAVNEQATRVDLAVDYSISGPLAQFSRAGIVKEIAGGITRIFAGNLEAMLADSATAGTDAAPPATSERPAAASDKEAVAPAAPPVAAAPPSLNLSSLIWSVLWQKIKGVFSSQNH